MNSETNGHLPNGYYVERRGSGRRVLYSPYLIPKVDQKIGGWFEGTEPRPVVSWTGDLSLSDMAEIARYDVDVMSKSPARAMALEELAVIFRGNGA